MKNKYLTRNESELTYKGLIHKDWLIRVYRVGNKGFWSGDARDCSVDNPETDIVCSQYGGKGAKKQVIEELKKLIDVRTE